MTNLPKMVKRKEKNMKISEKDMQRYAVAYDVLNELINIVEKNCGESWWALPGMSGYSACDMCYVFDFWKDLGTYLSSGGKDFDDSYLHSFSSLLYPPKFFEEE